MGVHGDRECVTMYTIRPYHCISGIAGHTCIIGVAGCNNDQNTRLLRSGQTRAIMFCVCCERFEVLFSCLLQVLEMWWLDRVRVGSPARRLLVLVAEDRVPYHSRQRGPGDPVLRRHHPKSDRVRAAPERHAHGYGGDEQVHRAGVALIPSLALHQTLRNRARPPVWRHVARASRVSVSPPMHA